MEVSQPLDHITHAVIGGGKTIDFGISNSAEFFDILSRTLYTDQILAVVREVLCNAWDAHIAAGITNKPIQITLDSDHFMVQDFGLGISHALIGPIYGVYGASTKTNDGLQTGGFGLGCKAPFAYTDHFEVVSCNAGTKTIYNMSKSNAVAKGKPGIITIASFPTEEAGLRVKMPILGKDWRRFEEVVKRIVSNGEMNAVLNTKALPVIPFSQASHGYVLTNEEVMGVNAGRHQRILLRYGNVIYPVETNQELDNLYMKVCQVLTRFDGYTVVLQAPPHSISVTPSREALSMQEHTIVTLKTLFKNFLANVKGLGDEILTQGKVVIDQAVADKHYDTLFSPSWGYRHNHGLKDGRITNVVDMARYQLTREYPKSVDFRVKDVDYRIRKAAQAKIVDSHLATTFLKELPAVKELPNKYSYTGRKHSSNWLHRRVIGKVMVKLRDNGMDDDALFVLDGMQPTYSHGDNRLIPVRKAVGRNHLINLPFLRKIVVITTAITQLQDRIRAYGRQHPELPQDGMLCYYVRSRKVENVAAALALFTKLGYEIIDLTKRHSWEVNYNPTPTPRKKAEPYSGLPALSTVRQTGGSINVSDFRKEDALRLPSPELVMIIGLRNGSTSSIDGFSTLATKGLVKLYGNRLGIAKDKIEFTRAIKNGAVDFMPVLEAEMQDMFLNSPNIAEYIAYDYQRVREVIPMYGADIEGLRAIYKDADLRKAFGLLNNLTADETAMVNVYNYSSCLSDDCKAAIKKHIDTIKLSPVNATLVELVTGNELLHMLDISRIRAGLLTPKRQIYLDVFLKVLKG